MTLAVKGLMMMMMMTLLPIINEKGKCSDDSNSNAKLENVIVMPIEYTPFTQSIYIILCLNFLMCVAILHCLNYSEEEYEKQFAV